MEERQTQVQVGAGLQESRLNTDLINFLQKYGSWALYALVVVVLIYVGNDWWNKRVEARMDQALAEYAAAATANSPEALLKVAQDHPGQGAVAQMATLDAARVYLESARRGLKPGADPAQPAPEDKLDESSRRTMIADASKLLDTIIAASGDDKLLLAQQARWCKATAQIDTGDLDAAVTTMKDMAAVSEKAGYRDQQEKALKRIDTIARLKTMPALLKSAELPESARTPAPAVAAAPDTSRLGPLAPGDTQTITPGSPQLRKVDDPDLIRRLEEARAKKAAEDAKKAAEQNAPTPAAPPAEPKPQ